MSEKKAVSELEQNLHNFLKHGFTPHFNQLKDDFTTEPKWKKMRELGTKLWLDSGNVSDIEQKWTREFSGLTVNNTLLNREIQSGTYDSLIPEIANLLKSDSDLTEQQIMLEMNFALNAYHGLRLAEKFDAYVSLEEHTDLANDAEQAIDYAKRLIAVCPERFCVKIPFTPAGLLAARKLSLEKLPVNLTLGFSARQNYLTARIAKPAYVNVFLGRLNSFIKDNDLGSGDYVGEKAALASQKAVRDLRAKELTKTKQIGASFRNGQQVHSLAGIDVMTIPPKVAGEFNDLDISPNMIEDRTGWRYPEGIKNGINSKEIRLDTLWNISQDFISIVNQLEEENLDSFTPDDLINFFADNKCEDVLIRWNDTQIQTSFKEGKIPRLKNWTEALKSRQIGLDSLMNLAGLNSFAADQKAMDNKIRSILQTGKSN